MDEELHKDELLTEASILDLDDAFDADLNDEGMEHFDEYEDDSDDPSFEDTDGDY